MSFERDLDKVQRIALFTVQASAFFLAYIALAVSYYFKPAPTGIRVMLLFLSVISSAWLGSCLFWLDSAIVEFRKKYHDRARGGYCCCLSRVCWPVFSCDDPGVAPGAVNPV
jgi:hypothetical protein